MIWVERYRPSWTGGVAVPKIDYCEATTDGTDGVVVQTRKKHLNNHPSCPGCAVQNSLRQIRGTKDWRESQALSDTGGVESRRTALLTQEGNSPAFTVAIILCVESILDSRAWP